MSDSAGLGGRSLHEDLLSTLEAFDVFAAPISGAVLFSTRWRNTSLPRNLKAATAASALGISSLDHARRRYTLENEPAVPVVLDRYLEAYFAGRQYMKQSLLELGEFEEGEHYGSYASAIALQRLDSGFRAAHILYRLGLNIEGDAIARQILEQIAWAFEASHLSELDDIVKVSSSRAISGLKKFIPGIGAFYGELSDMVHAGLRQHREHVDIHPDGSGRIVLARGRLARSAAILLRLADAWVAVCEYTQRDIVTNFRALASQRDLRLLEDRAFLSESQRLVLRIEEFAGGE